MVADGRPVFHAIVRRILEPEFEVVACVRTSQELLELAPVHRPDVLMVDILIRTHGGIAAIQALRTGQSAAWRVLVVTTLNDPHVMARARAVGADGYVLKTRAAEELPVALHAILGGGEFISPALIRA